MKAKGELYNSNIHTENVHEMYSSRMCSNCRYINKKSSLEIKECRECKIVIDRDINASKNIYYINKHMVEQSR